jgi:septal ring-binding cell division protein DamX
MDENTKLYVFSKREVALIFLFMFLIALTSFVFGVKIGKNYSYEQSGLTPVERSQVELLSGQEEKVNEVVKEVEESGGKDKVIIEDLNKKLEEHIKTETDGEGKRFDKSEIDAVKPSMESSDTSSKAKVQPAEVDEMAEATPNINLDQPAPDQYTGKYTINLGAYQSMEEAQGFAEGFKVRGYNPIINEVELPNKGIWYRVSLGIFENITEAKEYVKKEYSLFQGQDHFFARFD